MHEKWRGGSSDSASPWQSHHFFFTKKKFGCDIDLRGRYRTPKIQNLNLQALIFVLPGIHLLFSKRWAHRSSPRSLPCGGMGFRDVPRMSILSYGFPAFPTIDVVAMTGIIDRTRFSMGEKLSVGADGRSACSNSPAL